MTTSFMETRLPENLSKGARGGPQFSTSVTVLASGHEQRNINWSRTRAKYSISNNPDNQQQFDDLLAFFRVVRGRATGFRFKDWSDYQGAGEVLGTGDGDTPTFQLIKNYTAGSTTVARTITKPVSGTVSIYLDSVLLNSGYSVDTTTGVVTFSSPPNVGDIVAADFEFDVPVRFDTDLLSISVDELGIGTVKEVNLVELRV